MSASSSSRNTTLMIAGGLATAAAISLLFYYLTLSSDTEKEKKKKTTSKSLAKGKGGNDNNNNNKSRGNFDSGTPRTSSNMIGEEEQTPLVENRRYHKDGSKGATSSTAKKEERTLHARIEELDKKGKALFKNKQFVAAAETFTEALDLISEYDDSVAASSLSKQLITLMNNRSAMYEKANMPELALDDCVGILDLEPNHGKARTRKLRILENLSRWYDCLVEICAMQLLFMQAHRNHLRMGLPTPPPPVPQSKMEEVLAKVIPHEILKYSSVLTPPSGVDDRPAPSSYTILQLLKSYSGYHKWMAEAAKDGPAALIKVMERDAVVDAASAAECASGFLKRGRRLAYEGDYKSAMKDFEEGYQSLSIYGSAAADLMPNDDYVRLLEWAGMGRHWQYRLDASVECYEKAANLEPNNALIIVKQAGVCMDGNKHEEALKLFETALELDPRCVDALFHRSNCYMIQGKPELAKQDLEKCVQFNPNHVMARLRLASVLAAAQQDFDQATKQLDAAERVEPNSSEVQSYRGELHFTKGEMDLAQACFEKAIQLEPKNPTPYVNAALAILNVPLAQAPQSSSSPAMAATQAIDLLEKALAMDPQFMAAYIQLAQLKLGTATELEAARKVIDVYDTALRYVRTPDDLKELLNMRTLAQAQIDAATMLKMEAFNLQ